MAEGLKKEILIIKDMLDLKNKLSELFYCGLQSEIKYKISKPLPKTKTYQKVEWEYKKPHMGRKGYEKYGYTKFHLSETEWIKVYLYQRAEHIAFAHIPLVEIITDACEIDVNLLYKSSGSNLKFELVHQHIKEAMLILGFDLEFSN